MVESVRKELRSYFTAYGLGADGLNRENWVEAHCTMGESAKERRKQGDPIPMEVLADAYFEVLDEDDDGVLTMPELKKMMKVFNNSRYLLTYSIFHYYLLFYKNSK